MIKVIASVLPVLFLISTAFSQPLNTLTEEQSLEIANEKLQEGDVYNALEWFEKIYRDQRRKDPHLRYNIAKLHLELRDYRLAERWLERVIRGDRQGQFPESQLLYGKVLKMNGNYAEAIQELTTYMETVSDPVERGLVEAEIAGAEMAKDLTQDPSITNVSVLPNTVNSRQTDFAAFPVSADEIFYSSLRADDVIVIDKKSDERFVRIYRSTKTGNNWGAGRPLPGSINRTGFHHTSPALDATGQTMFFTRSTLGGNQLATSKLFMAKRTADGWGAVEEVNINGEYMIKHPIMGLIRGQEAIMFSSDMDGGYGGFDLYYAIRNGDRFEAPVNMGSTVNSAGNEEAPFYNEGTLYFSSDGHPGIGGFDIFKSTWDGANWSKPVNMGLGINSPADDLFYRVDETGYTAYITSNRPGGNRLKSETCCDDIWTIQYEVPVDLDLLVVDNKEESLLGTKVELYVMEGNVPRLVTSRNLTDINTSNFELEREKAYMVIASKDGYFSDTSSVLNTVGINRATTLNAKLVLSEIPEEEEIIAINQPIRFDNIYFDYDDDKILPASEPGLNYIFDLMTEYDDMVIEFSAHTDSRGSAQYNMGLSQRRAESSKAYLVNRGIDASRIVAKGYGATRLANHCRPGVNCTEEEHQENRRTEFEITAGPTEIRILRSRTVGQQQEEEKKN